MRAWRDLATDDHHRAASAPHPAYAALWAEMRAIGVAPGDPTRMPLTEARAANRRYYAVVAGEPPAVAASQDLTIPGCDGRPLRLRIHRPTLGRDLPVIMYFHGGGYAVNGLDTHDRLMRELAIASGRAVVGVGYSLAPEHRFPTQLREALVAVDWLARDGERHGLTGDGYAMAGDSAGAHLALSTALALRDGGRPLPQALVLAYGMYHRDLATPSHRLFGEGRHGLTSERMAWFWRHFLPETWDGVPALVEPLRADLHGLPPVHLVVAELDCLRDDSLMLKERLLQSGVPVRLDIYPGTLHSFLQFVRVLSPARAAIADIAGAVRCCPVSDRNDGARPAIGDEETCDERHCGHRGHGMS